MPASIPQGCHEKTTKYEEEKLVTNLKVVKFIYECIYNDPFITRSQLSLKINTKFNINYNLNQITKIYKQLKLTYKKPKYIIIKNIEFLDELIKKRYIDDDNLYDIYL